MQGAEVWQPIVSLKIFSKKRYYRTLNIAANMESMGSNSLPKSASIMFNS
jgi:hypothetical protein